jgi:signal transduction protein with GAF and PtsI domain
LSQMRAGDAEPEVRQLQGQTHLHLRFFRLQDSHGEGITGTVAKTHEHISINRASQDPRYKNLPKLQEEKYNAMLSFPIADKQDLYGVINLNTTSI